ncbi:MAG: DUF983 domain-containing protein [Chthoniobacterales bacterium]
MVAKAGAYLTRATRLLCPVCGRTPIFPRAFSVRRLWDWCTPLDGCPRCGYAFEREPGYFLMAVWAVNCGSASLLGMLIYLFLELNFSLPDYVMLSAVVIPVVLFNLLFVRHSKAYFIAIDHLLDPHERDGGDDRGNLPLDPDLGPTEPCESVTPVR